MTSNTRCFYFPAQVCHLLSPGHWDRISYGPNLTKFQMKTTHSTTTHFASPSLSLSISLSQTVEPGGIWILFGMSHFK